MYLIDTNVISEARRRAKADPGVRDFFAAAEAEDSPLFLSSVTIGELRRGIEAIRRRGDVGQARLIETWMAVILDEFSDRILVFDAHCAQVWGYLRVPGPAHEIDKQIAATALVHDLTLVTRNSADIAKTGVKWLNPFRP